MSESSLKTPAGGTKLGIRRAAVETSDNALQKEIAARTEQRAKETEALLEEKKKQAAARKAHPIRNFLLLIFLVVLGLAGWKTYQRWDSPAFADMEKKKADLQGPLWNYLIDEAKSLVGQATDEAREAGNSATENAPKALKKKFGKMGSKFKTKAEAEGF